MKTVDELGLFPNMRPFVSVTVPCSCSLEVLAIHVDILVFAGVLVGVQRTTNDSYQPPIRTGVYTPPGYPVPALVLI